MAKPHKSFSALARFTSTASDEAWERFQLDETDDDPPDGYFVAVSDVFGDDPEEVFVCEGDVHHKGDVSILVSGDYAGVYVIAGDLVVEGVLDYTQIDGGSILLVTGDVRARTVAVAQEAQLWVGGNLEAADYILADVSDAGGLAVKGTGSAQALIVTDRQPVAFGAGPAATMKAIERREGTLDDEVFHEVLSTEDALAPPFDTDEVEHKALVMAAKAGKKILR